MTFFKDVLLPGMDLTVTIRKADMQAIMQGATLAAFAGRYAQAGAEHANKGGELLKSIMNSQGRPNELSDEDTPEALALIAQASEQGNRDLVRESLVEPEFEELLARYRGKETHRTFGMGPDFTVLVNAIREHSGVKPVTEVDAASNVRFPEELGSAAGSDGASLGSNTGPSDAYEP
ncbi:hypothetical protein GO986_18040 [Deinococcus sp. HMF7620]|uniref:Uncharacterized protein n=1 Tax=Deinococcus arboris TaxID=2682977 RepID=A0A7C9LWV5_9DEIO|nr:hypothetical protein [Deinococcus arboris]MVN88640.1 hypothetical protein [Deinococcus arboris]